MGDLSPHFSRSEFDCPDGTRAAPTSRLIECLERLRSMHGTPLRILSGVRSQAYNRAVGGAPHSLHLTNQAADIVAGYATVEQAERAGFTGIGRCGRWAVHVDVRDAMFVVFFDC